LTPAGALQTDGKGPKKEPSTKSKKKVIGAWLMFEEILSPPTPRSQRTAMAGFGVFFAFFVITSAIAWFRWSGPMSISRKITVAQFIVGGVLSGVFLLTAKSTSPESNRKRMIGLLLVFFAFQFIKDVLR
jgi:hypothetical protein